jgi:GTP-binding protein HflX
MTDTVGFINRLPTHLIEAFKATFEEINEADLVLQVHDASDPHQAKKALVVKSLLDELKIDQNKIMHVYNKIDLVHDQSKKTAPRLTPFVQVSALEKTGLEDLVKAIDERLKRAVKPVELYLPAKEPSLLFKLARDGKIISQRVGQHFTYCQVELSPDALQKWSDYLTPGI